MVGLPEQEVRALGELPEGIRLLELGNKKNSGGLYRNWYIDKNVNYWCTDINGRDGAIPWDIREEIPQELLDLAPFDFITNFGFTEHVQTDHGQEMAWKNIHLLLKLGGKLCCTLPQPGYRKDHGKARGFPGIYYPHPEFFENYAELNSYIIEDLWISQNHLVCCRMIKKRDGDFIMPATGMFKNV